jgi:PAS domain S-box-containing protein
MKKINKSKASTTAKKRKEAEKLLRESEERYRLLADHMKDQVWLMDLNINMTYISPSVEKSIGYTLDDLKKHPLEKLLTEASFKKAMEFIAVEMPKALGAPSNYVLNRLLELEIRCKDDRVIWGEIKFSFIRDENGNPVSILGEGREITERKKAEEAREKLISELQQALSEVKTLSGMLPICASCKKIRNDKGYWEQIESYIGERSEAEFSHGICPDCIKKLYPEYTKTEDDGQL